MRNRHIFINSLLIFILLLIGSNFNEANCECLYDFEKDIQGWAVESHHTTIGASGVELSTIEKFSGDKSLKVKLNLSKESLSHSQGEIRVDLESFAPGDDEGPLNLDNKIVSAYVYLPREFGGESASPNGIQVFAKSVSVDSLGKEQWKSLYGKWYNAIGYSNNWIEVKLLISTKKKKGVYIEEGFDPKSIRFVGIKFALGGKASKNVKFSGDVFVDCISWEK